MARTTTTSLPPEIEISFTNVLLSVPTPNLIHKLGAMKESVPMHGGGKVRFRQYNKLSTATVPLGTTGISPPGQQLTAFDIDAELSYYGTFIDINEQVIINNQDPKRYGVSKSSLIDLEAYGVSYGDRAEGLFFIG